jgi:putative transposase
MNRGNRKAEIFEDNRDRRRFLRILIEEKERHGVDTLAGCQMGNHFHLLLTTATHDNLSEFMQQLEGRFARYSNWRHERVGHVFQSRFRAVAIEHDIHLLIALCYIFLNPVSAGLATRLEDYKWSTYAATVGLAPLPSYLSIEWLEALFPSESLEEAQLRFQNLMKEAKPVIAYLRQNEFGVDSEALKRAVRSYVGEQLQLGMLPGTYRSVLRSPMADLFSDRVTAPDRASAIYDAHVIHGYKLAEIARHLRLHPNTVSRIFRRTIHSRRRPESSR